MIRAWPLLLAAIWVSGGCQLAPQPEGELPRAVLPAAPVELQTCPKAPRAPAPPPPPRTIEQIGRHVEALEEARAASVAALRDCRRRLTELNEWIEAQRRQQ